MARPGGCRARDGAHRVPQERGLHTARGAGGVSGASGHAVGARGDRRARDPAVDRHAGEHEKHLRLAERRAGCVRGGERTADKFAVVRRNCVVYCVQWQSAETPTHSILLCMCRERAVGNGCSFCRKYYTSAVSCCMIIMVIRNIIYTGGIL